jgi:hypothetical protein
VDVIEEHHYWVQRWHDIAGSDGVGLFNLLCKTGKFKHNTLPKRWVTTVLIDCEATTIQAISAVPHLDCLLTTLAWFYTSMAAKFAFGWRGLKSLVHAVTDFLIHQIALVNIA